LELVLGGNVEVDAAGIDVEGTGCGASIPEGMERDEDGSAILWKVPITRGEGSLAVLSSTAVEFLLSPPFRYPRYTRLATSTYRSVWWIGRDCCGYIDTPEYGRCVVLNFRVDALGGGL
jgi:hypothetical protein